MKVAGFAILLSAFAFAPASASAQVPPLDHVIVVIMENHSYDQTRFAPYTASLIARYAKLTQSYAVTHPSLPNYLALWAGSTFNVDNDDCPAPGSPYTAANLGHACEAAGKTWRAYCEDLPSVGSPTCSDAGYRRKHAPWTDFSNLNHNNERPLTDLALDIASAHLPALALVVPNQCHSTHDCSVQTGDNWLAANVPLMLQGMGTHGVLIITWDEDDDYSGNHILTVFAGPRVKAGYSHTQTENHYSVLCTICGVLGIAAPGAAASESPIVDIWTQSLTAVGSPSLNAYNIVAVVPNPFNPQTSIHFSLPRELAVTGDIWAVDGSRVVTLLRDETLPAGDNEVRWDGRNARGNRVASGVYLFRLSTQLGARTARLVLVE
jgi:acid phosphatase